MKTLRISSKKRFVEQHKHNVGITNLRDYNLHFPYEILIKSNSSQHPYSSRMSIFQSMYGINYLLIESTTIDGRKA